MEPTTPSPEALRYPASTDYHWDQFNRNVTAAGIEGNWKPGWGTSNGPLGFGKAIYLEDYQVREKIRKICKIRIARNPFVPSVHV